MTNQKAVPSYNILINPRDLRALRDDIWCDDPVPAKLVFEKRQYNIDIAYRGAHIRKFKKKSYHITFQRSFLGVKEIHLNAELMDKSLLRNKLSLDFFSDIGNLSPESRHVNLTINGKYQGVYLQLESVDSQFLKRRRLPNGSIFYAEDDDANFSLMSPLDNDAKRAFDSGYSRKLGSKRDHHYLSDLVYKINTTTRSEFEKEIVNYIDTNKYLRWLSGVVCTQNFDGFIHNYALYRRDNTGLFEIIPWDYDATWGRDINGKRMAYDYVPITGYNTLTARILDVPSFRKEYRKILSDILDSQFTVDFQKPKIMAMHDQLRPYVLKDPYISSDIDRFDDEPDFIFDFINKRNHYLKKHLSGV
ncbi:spore coat protein H [Scopulibacillus darangshiensis]|uniref:Spore coat protein H n=1 Tax=Scopulibacillus darangshiensis TaxID=442528 RepID=A0A4R2NSU4_9BACL|nr:CotH kinase family protein [Scopulibacillus darangshiensis]TCP24508.1 spore coat protein H [Scopulibacillus darangshiensis]